MKKYLIISILAAIASGAAGFFVTKVNLQKGDSAGKKTESSPTAAPTQPKAASYPKTNGNFLVTDKEVCFEAGKPVVYFFGSASCPHCVWEKPVAQKVFNQFKNEISYHENFDSDKDGEVFAKYSDINPGYVPFLILGCKYARVGAGENLGTTEEESKKLEEEALSAILCKLTEGKPAGVCEGLKEKIKEVK